MTKLSPQKFASLIMVLKKLESNGGRANDQIIWRRPNDTRPSPLGGFFGTTRVNDLASDLSDVKNVDVDTWIRLRRLGREVIVPLQGMNHQPNPPNRFGNTLTINYVIRSNVTKASLRPSTASRLDYFQIVLISLPTTDNICVRFVLKSFLHVSPNEFRSVRLAYRSFSPSLTS